MSLAQLSGRIGGYRRWAKVDDRTQALAPARAGFMRRFEDQVDPDRKLPAEVRAQRADAAMRAHMAELQLRRWSKKGRR